MKRVNSSRAVRPDGRARSKPQVQGVAGRGHACERRDRAADRQSEHSGLSDQARARLEEMIVSLELPPGSIWSEAELSAKLGIGRTPVREALQRLEGDHLVRILQRHGAQITEINVVEQLLLLELRRALDRLIAADAARRSTAQERSQIAQDGRAAGSLWKRKRRCPGLSAPALRAQELSCGLCAQSLRRPRRHALLRHVAALLLSALSPGQGHRHGDQAITPRSFAPLSWETKRRPSPRRTD